MYGPEPWALWVYDRQGGTLLLGASYMASDSQPARNYVIYGPSEVFPVLTAGAPYWFSYPLSSFHSLWDRQQQELLLADFSGRSPLSDEAATLESVLGVPVTTEPRCEYAGTGGTLDDVVFATTPPLRLMSGSAGVLTLGGKDHNVWVRAGQGSADFIIYQR